MPIIYSNSLRYFIKIYRTQYIVFRFYFRRILQIGRIFEPNRQRVSKRTSIFSNRLFSILLGAHYNANTLHIIVQHVQRISDIIIAIIHRMEYPTRVQFPRFPLFVGSVWFKSIFISFDFVLFIKNEQCFSTCKFFVRFKLLCICANLWIDQWCRDSM